MGTNILTSSHSGKQRQPRLSQHQKTPDTQGRPLSPSSPGLQPSCQWIRNRCTHSQHNWEADRKQGLASSDWLPPPQPQGTNVLIPLAEPAPHPVSPGFSAKLFQLCCWKCSLELSKHVVCSWACLASPPAAPSLGAERWVRTGMRGVEPSLSASRLTLSASL